MTEPIDLNKKYLINMDDAFINEIPYSQYDGDGIRLFTRKDTYKGGQLVSTECIPGLKVEFA